MAGGSAKVCLQTKMQNYSGSKTVADRRSIAQQSLYFVLDSQMRSAAYAVVELCPASRNLIALSLAAAVNLAGEHGSNLFHI